MSNTLLLGLSLCSMVARVFPTEDSVQTNGTKGPMETIVIQRELNWGNMESRLANVESGIANVESGIADLKSLIMKLVKNGNGGDASQQVGGNNETSSEGENVVEDKNDVGATTAATTAATTTAATKKHCTDGGVCFFAFQEKKTWDEARSHCQVLGGHLATLFSREETRSLQKYLWEMKLATVWIGSRKGKTDGKNPGNWKWITGEQVPTDGTLGVWRGNLATLKRPGCLSIHWDSGQGIRVRIGDSGDDGGHDVCEDSCDKKHPYVCSKSKWEITK